MWKKSRERAENVPHVLKELDLKGVCIGTTTFNRKDLDHNKNYFELVC